jgi:hypothetical protein
MYSFTITVRGPEMRRLDAASRERPFRDVRPGATIWKCTSMLGWGVNKSAILSRPEYTAVAGSTSKARAMERPLSHKKPICSIVSSVAVS